MFAVEIKPVSAVDSASFCAHAPLGPGAPSAAVDSTIATGQ